jgi:hypothetical protein
MSEPLPRRTFLRLVAAGAGAAALPTIGLPSAADASEPSGEGYLGRVAAASATGLRIETDEGALRVQPAAGARMYSGAFGPISDPSAFIIGDRVAVQGERAGASLRATAIGSVFHRITARVTSVSADGTEVQTTAGVIGLHQGHLPYRDGERPTAAARMAVTVGDAVDGFAWQHPSTRETYFMLPGV